MHLKNTFLVLFFFLLISGCSLAELHVNVTVARSFKRVVQQQDDALLLTVSGVAATDDGGYVVVGRREFPGFGKFGFWLRTDENGAVQQSLDIGVFHGVSVETDIRDVAPLSGGGFGLCGYSISNSDGKNYLSVYFVNEQRPTYSHTVPSEARQLVSTEDNGVIVAGRAGNKGLILKVDDSGMKQWEQSFAAGTSVSIAKENQDVFAVLVWDFNNDLRRLIRIRPDGTIINEIEELPVFFSSSEKVLLAPMANGRYGILTERLTSIGPLTDLIFVENDGSEAGALDFDGVYVNSLSATEDGGIILCGTTDKAGSPDLLLAKIRADGSEDWQRVHGGELSEYGAEAIQLSDRSYFAAGTDKSLSTLDNLPGNYGIYLVKTDRDGKTE